MIGSPRPQLDKRRVRIEPRLFQLGILGRFDSA
jgi:hypothetical protein